VAEAFICVSRIGDSASVQAANANERRASFEKDLTRQVCRSRKDPMVRFTNIGSPPKRHALASICLALFGYIATSRL
jgi:hypothetical protein